MCICTYYNNVIFNRNSELISIFRRVYNVHIASCSLAVALKLQQNATLRLGETVKREKRMKGERAREEEIAHTF